VHLADPMAEEVPGDGGTDRLGRPFLEEVRRVRPDPSAAFLITHFSVLHAVRVQSLQLLPLVGLQLHANIQKKTRVGSFELRPRRNDLIDLRLNGCLVGSIRFISGPL